MATYTQGTINLSIEPKLAELDQLNVPMLGRIARYSTAQTAVKYNVNVAGATATTELVTANATTVSADNLKPASLPIGTYRLRSSFSVNEIQLAEMASQGEAPLGNLLELSSMGAKREIIQSLGAGIFQGTGANFGGVLGLGTLYSAVTAKKSTTAYAGLDPAVDAQWTTYVSTAFGSLTKAKLRAFSADYRQGSTTGVPATFTALVMSPTTALIYAAAFDSATVINAQYTDAADLGVRGLSFEGRPVVEDVNIADGVILFVNEADLRLYSFRQTNGGSQDKPEQGLLIYAKEMPSSNPQEVQFALYGMFQLALMERRSVGVLTGVTA